MKVDLANILRLSIPEKILLVEAIWDNIAEENKNVKISDSQLKLVQERFEEYQKNPSNIISWEEVKKEL